MQTECIPALFAFAPVEGRAVVAGFDGGAITFNAMCEALGVSRSGYYARASRPESVRAAADRSLAAEIRIAHKNSRSRSRFGSPRVHATLRAHGRPVARKRVACLMRGMGLSARRMVRPWSAQALRHVGPEEAGRCDALAENLRPRQLDRPDLSEAALRMARPDSVLARFSGYGQDGPTFPGNPRPVGWRANIRGAQPPSTEHRAIREKDAT